MKFSRQIKSFGLYTFLTEGVMSDINLKSKELKNEEEFLKWFFKKYGSKVKKNKESIEWAKSLYNDTVNESLN